MFLTKLNELVSARRSFISDKVNFVSLDVALLINIIHWTILYIKIPPSSQLIVLHYNIITGSDFLDKASFIYFIPGLSLIFLLLNAFLYVYFYNRQKVLAHMLNISSIAVQLIFLAVSLALIVVNER